LGKSCVSVSAEARSPRALLDEVTEAREVLVLTYTSTLEYFERFALADARALGALVTVISDATMVHADPVVVRRAGTQYLDARALCPHGAFHSKLFVIVGDGQARIAIGSGNLTLAGWNANAEIWTVLRADQDGGPETVRQVAQFLRDLAVSEVLLGPGAAPALVRVADRLDELPADAPGPQLLHSLHTPILEQLPEGPVEDLVLYSPFHDTTLAGTRALLDRLSPESWTAFLQPDTDVDGPALENLASTRGGRLAWISRHATTDDKVVPDQRYWHGKLVQWRQDATLWKLSGSPNLSAPALLQTVAGRGNCELALLTSSSADLTPAEGPPPPDGIAGLTRTSTPDQARMPAIVFISATVIPGAVGLLLHRPLPVDAALQRYDVVADQWRTSTTLPAGSDRYHVDHAAAPVSTALRVLLDDETTSNSVFVCDLDRVRRAQAKTIGKARVTPADIARLGLGNQLLADIDELRPHLLRAGAMIATPTDSSDEHRDDANDVGMPAGRPAPGLSLEDYLAACDPVLGQRTTEFALVLPVLPGVGGTLDDSLGTLDTDEDSDTEPTGDDDHEPTLAEQLRASTEAERDRYRRFLERLVDGAPEYPMVVCTLAARSVLHAVASDLWPNESWPDILADALHALGATGDEPTEYETEAAASLGAVGLGLLRTAVGRMSRLDEDTMRYLGAGRALTGLLAEASPEQIALLADDLPEYLRGTPGILAANAAIAETLHPLTGAARAVHLLADEYELTASVADGIIIELADPIEGVAEPRLIMALGLAGDSGPVYARGTDVNGRSVLGAWCAPWFAVERAAPAGRTGRAWRLGPHQTPAMLDWDDLPKAAHSWFGGQPRPDEVSELLGLIDYPGL
jgi:hypothetical protein